MNVSRKKFLKYPNFLGSTPAVFKSAKVVTFRDPPPLGDAPCDASKYINEECIFN